MIRFAPINIVFKELPPILWLFILVLYLSQPCFGQSRGLLVIVDLEPDDQIALMLLAAQVPEEIVSVGTTVMHAGRKQVLAERFLQQIGLAGIPGIQGSGGDAKSYLEIASSSAAREYLSEGHGLLPEAELALINRDMPRSSETLSQAIRHWRQCRIPVHPGRPGGCSGDDQC